MALLDDLFSALQDAQTPWAQEALRRMSTGESLSSIDEDLAARRPRQQAAPASIPRQAPPPSADVRNPGSSADPFAAGPARVVSSIGDINAMGAPAPASGPTAVTAQAPQPMPRAAPAHAAPAPANDMPDFSGGVSPVAEFLGLGGLFGGGERNRVQQLAYKALRDKGVPRELAESYARQPKLLAQVIPTLVGQNKPTDEMREYQFERQQRLARGESPESIPVFGEWKAGIKKAGAQSISIDQRGQGAFEQGVGKAQADRLDGIMKGASAARDELASLDAVKSGLDSYNQGSVFGSGKLGPAEATIRGYAAAVGIGNADTLSNAELVNSIQNRMALQMRNPDGGLGMPGAMSDADREFLKSSQVGLDKSAAGNAKMIDVARRLATRKIEIAQMAEEYATRNKSLTGFEAVVRDYAKANPLFADLAEKKAPGAAAPRNGQFRILGVR